MQIWKLIPMLCLAAGMAVVAEENPEFVGWMKATKTATDDLKKMEQKTGEQAVAPRREDRHGLREHDRLSGGSAMPATP